MPSLSSAPQSSLLFFIALLCRGAFLSQPLVCFSPERGRKLAEFKTAGGQQVIKKVPIRKHWKDNKWFFPQQAGDLPGSLLKGGVDTVLCECGGRQHGVLEEEYIKGYMETASGSKLLWNEQQSPGGYWDKPSQMLFPFLPTSGHSPVLTVGNRMAGQENLHVQPKPWACIWTTFTTANILLPRDFVTSRYSLKM